MKENQPDHFLISWPDLQLSPFGYPGIESRVFYGVFRSPGIGGGVFYGVFGSPGLGTCVFYGVLEGAMRVL